MRTGPNHYHLARRDSILLQEANCPRLHLVKRDTLAVAGEVSRLVETDSLDSNLVDYFASRIRFAGLVWVQPVPSGIEIFEVENEADSLVGLDSLGSLGSCRVELVDTAENLDTGNCEHWHCSVNME